MGNEPTPPAPTPKTGPCFFGEEHSFQTITTRDPFSGETLWEYRCVKCGASG